MESEERKAKAFSSWEPQQAIDVTIIQRNTQASTSGSGSGYTHNVKTKVTKDLLRTFQLCNPNFKYKLDMNPRRSLTLPSTPVSKDGYDNANSDLILYVNDIIIGTAGQRYTVLDVLGQGTFGQVVKCYCETTRQAVAVKIIKNQTAYYQQARMEIGILQLLNNQVESEGKNHIVRMIDFCKFKNHLCIVFELLSYNLYELLKHNRFHGLSINLVRVLVSQILKALVVLRESGVIHCDMKPENILLKELDSGVVKVIDFGSACFEQHTVYSYIQSRFYRSVEVVLGYPYGVAIDMWSLGCIAAELFLGLPLFPGASEYDLLGRIVQMLGQPQDKILKYSKNAHKYFKVRNAKDAKNGQTPMYTFMTEEEYVKNSNSTMESGKCYFKHSKLADIIGTYPYRSRLGDIELQMERQMREAFLDFLLGLLELDPHARWTPKQALQHPFITGEEFTGPYQPAPDPGVYADMQNIQVQQRKHRALSGGSCSSGNSVTGAGGGYAGLYESIRNVQAHAHAHAAAMAALQYSPANYLSPMGQSQGSIGLSMSYPYQSPLSSGMLPRTINENQRYNALANQIVGSQPGPQGMAFSPEQSAMFYPGSLGRSHFANGMTFGSAPSAQFSFAPVNMISGDVTMQEPSVEVEDMLKADEPEDWDPML